MRRTGLRMISLILSILMVVIILSNDVWADEYFQQEIILETDSIITDIEDNNISDEVDDNVIFAETDEIIESTPDTLCNEGINPLNTDNTDIQSEEVGNDKFSMNQTRSALLKSKGYNSVDDVWNRIPDCEIKAKLKVVYMEYPEGTETGKMPVQDNPTQDECCAFAQYVFYRLFDHTMARGHGDIAVSVNGSEILTFDDLNKYAKPGDFIYCYNDQVKNDADHFGIYLFQESGELYLYESNYANTRKVNITKPSEKLTGGNFSFYRVYHAGNYDEINSAYNHAIDCPVEGTQFQKGNGEGIYIQGWVSPREGLTSVDVFIDGNKKASLTEANKGIYERDDVSSYGKGYRTTINTNSLSLGNHTVNIKANYSGDKVVDLGTRNISIENTTSDMKVGDNVYVRAQILGENALVCYIYGTGAMYDRPIEDDRGQNTYTYRYDIGKYLGEVYQEKYGRSYQGNDYALVIQEGVTKTGKNAFGGNRRPSRVIFPNSLETISEETFASSRLTSVTIPGSVKRIEGHAFNDSRNLVKVNVENGVSFIGDYAFANTPITSFRFPQSINQTGVIEEVLGEDIFGGCKKLESVEFGGRIIDLPKNIFSGCESLKTVSLVNGLKTIQFGAFFGSGIKEFTVPEGVTSVDYSAFSCSAIQTVNLPQSLEFLDGFSTCLYLQTVNIKNVDYISSDAFERCTSLKSLVIPEGCEHIGYGAFSDSGIEELHIPKSVVYSGSIRGINGSGEPFDFGPVRAGDKNVKVFGVRGSYAEKYAQLYGYKFVATGETNVAVTGVTLSPSTMSLKLGQNVTGQLTATVNPSNATNKGVTWSSNNTKVAVVDKNGKVTAKGVGKATITVKTNDGGKTALCNVTVGMLHCQWSVVGGKSYWYENGVKQGTYSDPHGVIGDGTVRGREIYDPASNGWYWLDSVYDGAKAVGKEVWMPYVYQDEKKWSDADRRRIADESDPGMGDQVYRTIKEGKGKWVRYDENGKMLKGWVTISGELAKIYPEQKGNTYYYDNRTGLMAKGLTVIDGRTYYFDEITGVRK